MSGPASWRWLGHPGHFIAARRCFFRMATVVGDGRYLVSTVGEYQRSQEATEYTEIGWQRLYETMVFRVTEDGHECGCPSMDPAELDMYPHNTPQSAEAGHLAACHKWDAMEAACER